MAGQTRFKWDLLRTVPVQRLVHWPLFPVALQVLTLGAVVLLAGNGWGIGLAESADELKTLRKTNLTTLVVWGLWWPAMVWLTRVSGVSGTLFRSYMR